MEKKKEKPQEEFSVLLRAFITKYEFRPTYTDYTTFRKEALHFLSSLKS